jgi:Dolichyl-phosphate-mannose-protein mannosyltransferase
LKVDWALPEKLTRRQILLVTLALALAAGWLRYYRCLESVHPDSLLWFGRARRFWLALAEGDFPETNRAPHPGVTMMWLAGAVMKLRGLLDGPIDERGLLAVKLPGILLGTLSASLTFPLLQAVLGRAHFRPALVLAALLATEPLLIEQSRLAHLDMAAGGFVWLGMLTSLVAYERNRWPWALASGFLFGCAGLTKLSVAPLPAALMLILGGAAVLSRFRDLRGLTVASVVTVTALSTIYALWPALWSEPIDTLASVLRSSEKIADNGNVARGSRGRVVPEAALYARYLISVTPVETGILAALGVAVAWFVRPLRKHYLWLVLATVPYLVLISLAKKKLGRYALPATPMLLLLAGIGVAWLAGRLRGWRRLQVAFGAALCALFVGRYVHAARLLPSAVQCTPWLGTECSRPLDMYFVREIALFIEKDWRRPRPPRVWNLRTKLSAPWFVTKEAKSARSAHYLVVWDSDFANAEEGRLARRSPLRKRLGKELGVVRHDGAVVARVYRAR